MTHTKWPMSSVKCQSSATNQGVMTGCQFQYAPNDIVAVPLEKRAMVVSTRQETDLLSGESAKECHVQHGPESRRFLRIVP